MFIERTIQTELVEELAFLVNYDEAKAAAQEVVDMPDRLIRLFLRLCLQGGGRLSARKRASHFAMLSDEEMSALEQVVRSAFQLGPS